MINKTFQPLGRWLGRVYLNSFNLYKIGNLLLFNIYFPHRVEFGISHRHFPSRLIAMLDMTSMCMSSHIYLPIIRKPNADFQRMINLIHFFLIKVPDTLPQSQFVNGLYLLQ